MTGCLTDNKNLGIDEISFVTYSYEIPIAMVIEETNAIKYCIVVNCFHKLQYYA